MVTFLTSIGSKTYNVLRGLLAPVIPSSVKLTDLVTTLRDHYEPKLIVIAERFHFHKREQPEGEGVAAYSAALKNCSEHCTFGTFLEKVLRDRFVCGLRSRQIQKRLLAEKSLTWKTAVEMALVDKQPDKFSRNSPADSGIHYVRSPHLLKATKPNRVSVAARTTSRKSADLKKNYVGIVSQKGISPKFVRRKHPHPQVVTPMDHVRIKVGEDNQFGTWRTTSFKKSQTTTSNYFTFIRKSLNHPSWFL